MPVVDEVSVDVRADDAQFRDVMRRFDRTVTAADGRTITVGATTGRGGPSGVGSGRPGDRAGPASEGGEDKRSRTKERNDERRHRETSRLLKGVIAVAGVTASSQGLLGPLPQLATNLLMAPFINAINEIVGKIAGPVTGGLGLIDKTVDVIDKNTFGGERGNTPAEPDSALGRSRTRFGKFQNFSKHLPFRQFADVPVGIGLGVYGAGEELNEGLKQRGVDVGKMAGDLLWGGPRWFRSRGIGYDPDSLQFNPMKMRSMPSWRGN